MDNTLYLDLEPGSYNFAHCSLQSPNASSLHAQKEMGSTMVGCLISQPGKTPHVTAIGWSFSMFVQLKDASWFKTLKKWKSYFYKVGYFM